MTSSPPPHPGRTAEAGRGHSACTDPAELEDVVDPVGESLLLHPQVLCLQLVNVAHLIGRVHGGPGLGQPPRGTVAGLVQESCSRTVQLGIVGLMSHQDWSPLGPRGPKLDMPGVWRLGRVWI